MATLAYLAEIGKLKKHEADLEHDEMPNRYVYFSLEAANWISTSLFAAPSNTINKISPYEQVEQQLFDFVIGRPMVYSFHHKVLQPIGHWIWEIRTPDVRLIGWFPLKGTFLVVCGRLKSELTKPKYYNSCIQHAIWFRNQIDLETPKFVPGISKDAIL